MTRALQEDMAPTDDMVGVGATQESTRIWLNTKGSQGDQCQPMRDREKAIKAVCIGAIQVLRNADGGGGECDFLEKAL